MIKKPGDDFAARFFFNLKHDTEFLNGDSAQLDDEAIKVNVELEKLRSQMREEERANEELRRQLATAEARLRQGAPAANSSSAPVSVVAASAMTAPPSPGVTSAPGGFASASATLDTPKPESAAKPPSETAAAANDEGMRLYQEKRYADAAAKFVQASALQPNVELYANNAGFAFYRLAQYDDAVKWFLQTISLDPKRAVAWLNLGDAYLNLQKKAEARDAYDKFLALSPNSKSAPDVREKLKSLP